MLGRSDWQETDEWNLHTGQRAESVPSAVSDVNARAKPTHQDQHEDVQRDQVGNEDVASPRGHHVSVKQGTERTPERRTELHGFDPEVESEYQQENSNRLIVITPRHRSRDISRRDTHKDGRQQTRARGRAHFIGKEVCSEGGQPRESWCEKHADIADVDGDGEGAEGVVDGPGGHHETGVEGAAGDAPERVPGAVVEPVPEVVKAVGDEIFCCAEVEPWVDCVVSVCMFVKFRCRVVVGFHRHSWMILSNPIIDH